MDTETQEVFGPILKANAASVAGAQDESVREAKTPRFRQERCLNTGLLSAGPQAVAGRWEARIEQHSLIEIRHSAATQTAITLDIPHAHESALVLVYAATGNPSIH